MTSSVTYTSLDGSTRVGEIIRPVKVSKKGKLLTLHFKGAAPRALEAGVSSILSVFVGDRGWVQFDKGKKKPSWREVVRDGRGRWVSR